MSIHERHTGRNTLRGLFVAATVAAIATSLAGCLPKVKGPTGSLCSCTCNATTTGGSKIKSPQTIPLGSSASCGAHEGDACTVTGTWAGVSFVGNGSMASCADARTRPTGQNNNEAPNSGQAHQ